MAKELVFMKSISIALMAALFWLITGHCEVNAQISHVTVRTPKSPGPPMVLVQSNSPPATSAPQLQRPVRSYRIITPTVDKGEQEKRVVAFQQQRASEGFSSAQHELGRRLLEGNGIAQDVEQGKKWLTLAAECGHSQARRKLEELNMGK
jgi:hypothetical protein